MKALHNFIETRVKPHFTEGGKLSRLYVVYDGLETFLFTPGETTNSGTHIRDGIDLKRTMITVVMALVPALLFGTWNIGHQYYLSLAEGGVTVADPWSAMFLAKMTVGALKILPLIVVSYGVGLAVEFIFAASRGHGIHEGFLVSGMLIPLIMPVDIPLWMVALATVFAVIVAKEVFGGTGMNILNVALTARAFLFFSYPKQMSGEIWVAEVASSKAGGLLVDGTTGATALGELANTVGQPIADSATQTIMGLFADGGAYDLMSSLVGTIPGSIGETSAIAIGMGALILIWTGIGNWRIITSFLLGGLVMGWIFNLMDLNAYMGLPPLHQIALGGFLFGAVFMATDPVTATQTRKGMWIYGFLAGLLSIMIRVFNPAYPEGVMMAILFMNVMAPTIDHYVVQANINSRAKRK
ncbi:MAG: NADH:ubiquinone reductase (Na(+)-transporting) subunit B [Flavobacteriales bacterium]|nr:NADH:ubiquinone reductase (Na(+)-transporting) subunit B [Flavobacteriales bacterium]